MIITKNQFNLNKKSKKSAFSLIEISIVILVISLLVVGVIIGKRIIKNAKIASAKSMTASSPIPLIDGLVFWAESASDNSFNPAESIDGLGLSNWYERSGSNIVLEAGNTKPIYSYDGIANVPAVQFNDNNDQFFSFNCSFLNHSDYTIIISEQRGSDKANNYFIQGDNNNLFLGYYDNSSIIHSQNGSGGAPASPSNNSNSYSAAIFPYSKPIQRQIIFTSSSSGKKIYINGMHMATSNDNSQISNLSTCYIGKNYDGRIGEIAIYNRALNVTTN